MNLANDAGSKKKELRQKILNLRRSLPRETIRAESEAIAGRLYNWPEYVQARTVMLFLSMPDEVQTRPLIEHAWQQDKTVCVPYPGEVYGYMQAAVIHNFAELSAGKFGILVPDERTLSFVAPEEIDLVIVPGVAFDALGRRCGMGAGYYDRFLQKTSHAVTAGVALSCQMVSEVVCAEHDQTVDCIVTKDQLIKCGEGKM